MRAESVHQIEVPLAVPESPPGFNLLTDPRWLAIERIAGSEPFQKSSRLPALLRYLARCTILGERHGLSEQRIGRAVFGKPEDYTPAEDSSVRVYVRQLRLRLHEYYQADHRNEPILVSVPKGGYTLTFSTAAQPHGESVAIACEVQPHAPTQWAVFLRYAAGLLLVVAVVCALGWYQSAAVRNRTPWPLNQVIRDKFQTTLVLADAGYSLRMLGDQEIPLDRYVDRTFVSPLVPEHMSAGEARLIHYLEVSRITSIADAHAAAAFSALAGSLAQNLVIRSARNLNSNDLSHGDFIFIGAKTSNPWVELFDDRLNFQFVEEGPGGDRYIVNRKQQTGEKTRYSVPGNTGLSGEDYATIALLPAKNGNGNVMLIQGLRMEGTEAAIELLRNENQRLNLRQKLASANGNRIPVYFEVLLHAQSIAGSPVSMEFIAVRIGE